MHYIRQTILDSSRVQGAANACTRAQTIDFACSKFAARSARKNRERRNVSPMRTHDTRRTVLNTMRIYTVASAGSLVRAGVGVTPFSHARGARLVICLLRLRHVQIAHGRLSDRSRRRVARRLSLVGVWFPCLCACVLALHIPWNATRCPHE